MDQGFHLAEGDIICILPRVWFGHSHFQGPLVTIVAKWDREPQGFADTAGRSSMVKSSMNLALDASLTITYHDIGTWFMCKWHFEWVDKQMIYSVILWEKYIVNITTHVSWSRHWAPHLTWLLIRSYHPPPSSLGTGTFLEQDMANSKTSHWLERSYESVGPSFPCLLVFVCPVLPHTSTLHAHSHPRMHSFISTIKPKSSLDLVTHSYLYLAGISTGKMCLRTASFGGNFALLVSPL